MPHFFIKPQNISATQFKLDGDEVRHLVTVRRCAAGDTLRLFDGTGKTYVVRVDVVDRGSISGAVLSIDEPPVPSLKLHLYCAVPKGDRFDWLVEKAAELGLSSVTPLVTERSVMRDIAPSKVERWKRLAVAACQQCGRSNLLDIRQPQSLNAAIDALAGSACVLMPWEAEETLSVEQAFVRLPSLPADVALIIGPEGGFSPAEVDRAQRCNAAPVTLGPRILRVETAALLAAILVLDQAGSYAVAGNTSA